MAQQAQEEAVIEIFLLIFAHTGIPDTDRPGEVGVKIAFHRSCVSIGKCGTECVQHLCISAGFPLEPFQDLVDEDLPDLKVRYRQIVCLTILTSTLCQVAGGKKDAPKVVDGGIEISIGQLLIDLFRDRLSVDQPFQLQNGIRRTIL